MYCANRTRCSALAAALVLAACSGPEAPLPTELHALAGTWTDARHEVVLTIWEDASVRVRIPSLDVDVLTHLSKAKRGYLVDLGGAWQAPARLVRRGHQLVLLWPSDPARTWTLSRTH